MVIGKTFYYQDVFKKMYRNVCQRINARWYDQSIGRFISEDPVKDEISIKLSDSYSRFMQTERKKRRNEEDVSNSYIEFCMNDSVLRQYIEEVITKDGVNLFIYCLNNPIIYFDPDGKRVELIIGYKYDPMSVPHAAIRITNESGDWVYSFGRYDDYGKLIKIDAKDYLFGYRSTDSSEYIKGQTEYRSSKGYVLNVSQRDEKEMQEYAESFLANQSQVKIEKGRYFSVPLKYDLLSQNCSTFVGDVLMAGDFPVMPAINPLELEKWIVKYQKWVDILQFWGSDWEDTILEKTEYPKQ